MGNRFCFIILFCVMALLLCSPLKKADTTAAKHYHRIISFAPSITETLFVLGLGDRVFGVTRFCTYPPRVKNLPKIGGYLDPNYEMILSLKPDLVLLLKEHSMIVDFLKKNFIDYKIIDNENVGAILQSFHTIGSLCGKANEADTLVQSIRSEISNVTHFQHRPRILFCIGRDNPGIGAISKVYIAGPKSFYSQLMLYAGGENAFRDSLLIYPSFSSEGIIRLSPDIIIDLMASIAGVGQEKVKQDWKALDMVPAVKNNLVFCPTQEFMTIPGPRIGLIVREMKKAVEEYQTKMNKEIKRLL
jgi:iron complex transport system substrate-binding protein